MTTTRVTVTLHHGTTLRRARLIEAHGPDPNLREPGGRHQPPAEAFSTCIAGVEYCATGLPEEYAHLKHAQSPTDGGPAILEIHVPDWIVNLLYADPISAGVARGGELRFEPENGLNELRAEWPNLTKQVIPL